MSFFDNLYNVTYKKKEEIADEAEFNHFMVQRWISFLRPEVASILNNSSNILWGVIEDKQTWNKLFCGVIPKSNFKNIKYFKKTTKDKKTKKIPIESIEKLSDITELSKREVLEYVNNIDIKKLRINE